MKEINLPSGNYIFVKVPDDATDLGMETNNEVSYRLKTGEYKRINTGAFTFNVNGVISTTNDITEEQCESIVEKYTNYETEREQLLDGMYEDYLQKGNYWVHDSSGIKLWAFKTAKESLQSLIQSVGLDLKLNYLIIKKL